jgi:hypothetical protein
VKRLGVWNSPVRALRLPAVDAELMALLGAGLDEVTVMALSASVSEIVAPFVDWVRTGCVGDATEPVLLLAVAVRSLPLNFDLKTKP